jgi:tetratricopeptide (TPR) repeat protein
MTTILLLFIVVTTAFASLADVMRYFAQLPPIDVFHGLAIPPLNGSSCVAAESAQWLGVAQFAVMVFWPFEAMRALAHVREDCAMKFVLLADALAFNRGYAQAEQDAIRLATEWPSPSELERLRVQLLGVSKRSAVRFDQLMRQALEGAWADDVELLELLWIKKLTVRSMRSAGRPSPVDRALAFELLERIGQRERDLSLPLRLAYAHYRIHAYDDTLEPQKALAAADFLLDSTVPHLLHMAGHIYYMLGSHAAACDAFHAARVADEAYMLRASVEPANNWNSLHNLAFDVLGLVFAGRSADALTAAHRVASMRLEDTVEPEPLPFSADESRAFGRWMFQGFPAIARVHWAFGRFEQCAAAMRSSFFRAREIEQLHDSNQHFSTLASFLALYCEGMAHVTAEQPRLEAANQVLANATSAMHALEECNCVLSRLPGRGLDVVRVHFAELSAAVSFVHGSMAEANEMFARALSLERGAVVTEPPMFSRSVVQTHVALLLRAPVGDLMLAERLCNEQLALPPFENGFVIALAARVAEARGERHAARALWASLLETWSHADEALDEMRAAMKSELRR